jgi:two-component system, chemotaxis family, protein-glutamate methylesterase/glutaminase
VIKLLVIDDSALVRKLIGHVFAAEAEFQVRFARDGLEGLEQLRSFKPDVVTLDLRMPHMDGLACLDRIVMERPTPVVMVASLTADDVDATLEAFRLGAVDFVAKPNGPVSLHMAEWGPELLAKVRGAAGAKLRSSLRLRDRVRHQVGGSPRPRPIAPSPRGNKPSHMPAESDGLVLVGTSTGGPPALEALLTRLPSDFPWPVLIAQHMPASFTGPLARRLDGISALTVSELTQPTRLAAGHVYIGQGGLDLVVGRQPAGLVAMVTPPQAGYPWHPSMDRLVRTAMEHLPARQLIGVLMTGMGNDGASALTLAHERGGRTIAEAEETAVIWGMPGELVKAGGADWIVPLPGIADRLLRLVS